nr:hypothetical protein [Saprospira grandis]
MFWGCPALRAGRAVSQLAVRSALRRLRRLGLAFGHCCPSLSRYCGLKPTAKCYRFAMIYK